MTKIIKILIVDDDEQALELIEESIKTYFHDVKTIKARDGLEAYHYSMSMEFDLIITDHTMPYCTGIDFISKLRSSINANKNCPTIIISNYIPELEDKLIQLTDILYMDKPFKQERLLRFCKMLMNKNSKSSQSAI